MIRVALAELLEQKERSVYWLAKETGVSEVTLYRMANKPVRKVDLKIVDKICRALECEIQDLLVRTKE